MASSSRSTDLLTSSIPINQLMFCIIQIFLCQLNYFLFLILKGLVQFRWRELVLQHHLIPLARTLHLLQLLSQSPHLDQKWHLLPQFQNRLRHQLRHLHRRLMVSCNYLCVVINIKGKPVLTTQSEFFQKGASSQNISQPEFKILVKLELWEKYKREHFL